MSIAVPLYGFGASGGTGGTLTVTAPANVTVTVSKDDKIKIKNSGMSGITIFKNLEAGTWTVTITNEKQTATKTIVVTTEYSMVIAFFSATINITYPAGSTCTCTNGSINLIAPDTTGSWACIVPSAGNWTVNSTDGDKSKSAEVVIATDGQTESITLLYITYLFKDGETYDSLTGGWNGVVDSEKKALQLYAAPEKTASVWTKKKVNLTDYSTMLVTTNSNTRIGLALIITSAVPGETWNRVAETSLSHAEASTNLSLDISKVTGEYFVWLSAYSEKGAIRYIYEVSMQ